jgi:hypothetical protein
MTEQQQTAIENPCEFAEQCANRRYAAAFDMGDLRISVLLTLNVGEE